MSGTHVIDDPLLYLALCVALALTPGPDVALVIRAAATSGARAALPVIWGIATGLLVHVACSVVGVSAILAASDTALTTLRVAGALWIGWMAVATLRDALPRRAASEGVDAGPMPGWRIGFVTNVLNAKILLFYLAFLPQFAPADQDFARAALVLAAIQIAIGVGWFLICATIAGSLRRVLRPGAPGRRILDIATGSILLIAALELLRGALH